jgi:hypothetical protein
MDVRLSNNAVFQVVGPSGSGKTHFVLNLLKNRQSIFIEKVKNIFWIFGIDDKIERQKIEKIINGNVTFIKGFEKNWMTRPQKNDVIVIDDLFVEATKEKIFNNLFTKIARHNSVTVIFLTQNLFAQGNNHRTRNLNVHYLILFKNPRDLTVVDFLSRQCYGRNSRFLIDAFHDATVNTPHSYIFLDFTQKCLEELRVRTDIFNKDGIIIYKQSNM